MRSLPVTTLGCGYQWPRSAAASLWQRSVAQQPSPSLSQDDTRATKFSDTRSGFAAVEIHGLHGRHQFQPDSSTDVAIDVAWAQVHDLSAKPPQSATPPHRPSVQSLSGARGPTSGAVDPLSTWPGVATSGLDAAGGADVGAGGAPSAPALGSSRKDRRAAARAAAAELRDTFGCGTHAYLRATTHTGINTDTDTTDAIANTAAIMPPDHAHVVVCGTCALLAGTTPWVRRCWSAWLRQRTGCCVCEPRLRGPCRLRLWGAACLAA